MSLKKYKFLGKAAEVTVNSKEENFFSGFSSKNSASGLLVFILYSVQEEGKAGVVSTSLIRISSRIHRYCMGVKASFKVGLNWCQREV